MTKVAKMSLTVWFISYKIGLRASDIGAPMQDKCPCNRSIIVQCSYMYMYMVGVHLMWLTVVDDYTSGK